MPPPRTLNEADIVVSISGESLQAQVKALYDTKLDDETDYIINRNVRISFRKKNGDLSKYGLFGYIECPQIDLTGDAVLNRDGKFSIAKLSIKFVQNPKKTGKEGESYLFYNDMEEEEDVKKNINGYTLSWDVNVGFRDIQSVLKDIVSRGNVPKKAKNELDKYVGFKPEELLVSTLFCSFESSRMMNSFKMMDADGNFVDVGPAAFAINTIVSHFKDAPDGTPSPNNPFLLGYTISQKVPTLTDVNGNPLAAAPRYFVPSSLICSVSPRVPCPHDDTQVPVPLPSSNDKCQGAINYIMRTLRPDGIGMRPALVRGDGRFDENLFSTIGRKAMPGGLDGLMVLSANTFAEWFLSTFVKRDLIETYEKELVADGYEIYVRQNGQESGPTVDGSKIKFYSYIEKIGKHKSDRHEKTKCLLHRRIFNTERHLEVEFSNTAPVGTGDDVQRSVQIVLTIKTTVRYDKQDRLGKRITARGRGLGKENGDQNDPGWTTPVGFEMRSNLQYTFHFQPSTNRGQMELKVIKTLHLNDDKTVNWKNLEKHEEEGFRNHYWGITTAPSTRLNWISKFFLPSWVERYVNQGKGLGEDYTNALDGKVGAMGEMLKTSVFFPASEVFMFKGADVDGNGNVYVGIAYDTINQGTRHPT